MMDFECRAAFLTSLNTDYLTEDSSGGVEVVLLALQTLEERVSILPRASALQYIHSHNKLDIFKAPSKSRRY